MEETIITPVKVGDNVPDMEFDAYLPGKLDFVKISFSDIFKKGEWLILFFYPADFTFVCPTELADIGEKHESFSKEGARLISMSTDTHFSHYAWHRQEKLLSGVRYPMGADPSHRVSRAFGVYDEKTGLALRGSFIADPDGRLVSSEVHYYNVGRSSEELLRKFMAFRHVRKNPAAVCPAKWEPGARTLETSNKNIGNVYGEIHGK